MPSLQQSSLRSIVKILFQLNDTGGNRPTEKDVNKMTLEVGMCMKTKEARTNDHEKIGHFRLFDMDFAEKFRI
jgi:hypothetical protein